MAFRSKLLESWRQPNLLTVLLWPLSLVYRLLFAIGAGLYRLRIFKRYKAPVPVLVVGNITVGGTGKSPLVIYLVELLRKVGYSPGVISRGYKSNAKTFPYSVKPDSPVNEAGDEPLMIVRRTGVPLVIGPNRAASIQALLASHDIDIVISDDGLQHLALQRDIELCVVDESTQQNNFFLLPAGPYRESLGRLESVDFVIHHGGTEKGKLNMALKAGSPQPLDLDSVADFHAERGVHAVAGIGNPRRFFKTCRALGYEIVEHVFPDHHEYSVNDLKFESQLPVLMTEKDAVKCQKIAEAHHWYLPVDATLGDGFDTRLVAAIRSIRTP